MEDSLLDNRLRLSFYREIGVLDKEHGIFLVQRTDTGKLFSKKQIPAELETVYLQLKKADIPGVPKICEILWDGDALIAIEEYISGRTLEEILREKGKLSANEAMEYSLQICDILTRTHSLKPAVIHRDIKPSNVIISSGGRVFLIDFDAAKQEKKEERDTRLIGTAGYAAPEQYGFGASGIQTDLYGLGILMTEMLTGTRNPKLVKNPRFIKPVRRCIQLDAGKRYASAGQLKRALQGKNRTPLLIVGGIFLAIFLTCFTVYRVMLYLPDAEKAKIKNEKVSEAYRELLGTEAKTNAGNTAEREDSGTEPVWKDGRFVYFSNEREFEEALDRGEDLAGTVVTFTVTDFRPDSGYGYNLWSGDHLNFVSEHYPGATTGDVMTVLITTVTNHAGSWIIQYETLDIQKAEADTETSGPAESTAETETNS